MALGATVSGCAVGPNYVAPSNAALAVPDQYHYAAAPAPQNPAELATWWQQFNDPALTALIDQAIARNLDIGVAISRLRQAREGVVQSRAAGLPQVSASAGVSENYVSRGNDNFNTNYNLGANASWEADLFGGIRRGVEASRADEEGSGYDLGSIRISIISEVVSNYIQARTTQQRLANARETLRIAEDNLEITRWRMQAGLVSSRDAEQARTQRAQAAATIPSLESSFASDANRLAVLTGQVPGSLAAMLGEPRPIPTPPENVALGIPADTLRQRPDVRRAERSLASATARIGVAEAQLYPSLRLSGNIGTSALTPAGLLDVVTGGLAGSLAQTIFDGGRLRSQVRSQRAAAEGAYDSYRQTVLSGLEDVENSLVSLQSARARHVHFLEALDAANNSAILARSQYRAGLTDFLTLQDAERSLFSARDGLANAIGDEALSVAQLYRALGGGWDPLATPEQLVQSRSEGRS
jgi:NodT family efflux transporter outer membrane factor (OMF) lipoprotein